MMIVLTGILCLPYAVFSGAALTPVRIGSIPARAFGGQEAEVFRSNAEVVTVHTWVAPEFASEMQPASLPPLEGLLDRFIVIPEHRLLFCYIDKVASKHFNDMFRNLRSRYDPSQLEGKGWGPVWFRNTPAYHNVTTEMLQHMLVDETWHKAVFFRDPIERFVSAFKSKCEHRDADGARHCKEQFGETSLPFGSAVALIRQKTRSTISADDSLFDSHFRRQRDFCGGLGHTLQYYDTVEQLDRVTSSEKVRALLRKIGVDTRTVPKFERMFPRVDDERSISPRRTFHYTNAAGILPKYLNYSNSWASVSLVNQYQEDYDTFGLEVPWWVRKMKNHHLSRI